MCREICSIKHENVIEICISDFVIIMYEKENYDEKRIL